MEHDSSADMSKSGLEKRLQSRFGLNIETGSRPNLDRSARRHALVASLMTSVRAAASAPRSGIFMVSEWAEPVEGGFSGLNGS